MSDPPARLESALLSSLQRLDGAFQACEAEPRTAAVGLSPVPRNMSRYVASKVQKLGTLCWTRLPLPLTAGSQSRSGHPSFRPG